jgi:hypothetical protein
MKRRKKFMIYAKIKVNDDLELRTAIYGDEFYSHCPVCGKEVAVDIQRDLPENSSFSDISVYCDKCNEATKPYIGDDGKYDYFNMLIHAELQSELFTFAVRRASEDDLRTAFECISEGRKCSDSSKRLAAIDGEIDRRESIKA